MTGIYRSTNSGGGTGTSFATIPYGNSAEGNLSEARLSAQSSRLSIRVNAAPAEHRASLAGYFEMDFNGATPGNVAVTSTSAGFRLRNAFGEAQFNRRFIVAAGQAYTLMTPAKDQLSIWPSDYELTHAIDMNYVAGMLWGRMPQVRFTYRPTPTFNWALSVENPEQQLGSGVVTLPSCCGTDLADQYNTGNNGLAVPNLMPDLVSRVAYNAGKTFHVDAGGVVRVFRHTLKPYTDSTKQAGGGASVNGRLSLAGARANVFGQFATAPAWGATSAGSCPTSPSARMDASIRFERIRGWRVSKHGCRCTRRSLSTTAARTRTPATRPTPTEPISASAIQAPRTPTTGTSTKSRPCSPGSHGRSRGAGRCSGRRKSHGSHGHRGQPVPGFPPPTQRSSLPSFAITCRNSGRDGCAGRTPTAPRSAGNAPQPTLTSVRPRRGLASWMACASTSLPTPVSPSNSTVAGVGATWCTAGSRFSALAANASDATRESRGAPLESMTASSSQERCEPKSFAVSTCGKHVHAGRPKLCPEHVPSFRGK